MLMERIVEDQVACDQQTQPDLFETPPLKLLAQRLQLAHEARRARSVPRGRTQTRCKMMAVFAATWGVISVAFVSMRCYTCTHPGCRMKTNKRKSTCFAWRRLDAATHIILRFPTRMSSSCILTEKFCKHFTSRTELGDTGPGEEDPGRVRNRRKIKKCTLR